MGRGKRRDSAGTGAHASPRRVSLADVERLIASHDAAFAAKVAAVYDAAMRDPMTLERDVGGLGRDSVWPRESVLLAFLAYEAGRDRDVHAHLAYAQGVMEAQIAGLVTGVRTDDDVLDDSTALRVRQAELEWHLDALAAMRSDPERLQQEAFNVNLTARFAPDGIVNQNTHRELLTVFGDIAEQADTATLRDALNLWVTRSVPRSGPPRRPLDDDETERMRAVLRAHNDHAYFLPMGRLDNLLAYRDEDDYRRLVENVDATVHKVGAEREAGTFRAAAPWILEGPVSPERTLRHLEGQLAGVYQGGPLVYQVATGREMSELASWLREGGFATTLRIIRGAFEDDPGSEFAGYEVTARGCINGTPVLVFASANIVPSTHGELLYDDVHYDALSAGFPPPDIAAFGTSAYAHHLKDGGLVPVDNGRAIDAANLRGVTPRCRHTKQKWDAVSQLVHEQVCDDCGLVVNIRYSTQDPAARTAWEQFKDRASQALPARRACAALLGEPMPRLEDILNEPPVSDLTPRRRTSGAAQSPTSLKGALSRR